jgi:integrase
MDRLTAATPWLQLGDFEAVCRRSDHAADAVVAALTARAAATGHTTHPGPTDLTTDEVVTKLGFEHLRRHDLRHTGLTWMADAGVPVHVLRKIAGHGSLTTTQRYLHPDRKSFEDASTALSAHLKARRSQSGPKLRAV